MHLYWQLAIRLEAERECRPGMEHGMKNKQVNGSGPSRLLGIVFIVFSDCTWRHINRAY